MFAGRWLWSAHRPACAWFRRADHYGDPRLPLDACIRTLVEQATGRRPAGPIRLLTQLRYGGYYFNPISIYYCFAPDDNRLEALVAEVTNTPWGERHCYVMSAEPQGRQHYRFPKALHVSPFMPMKLDYDWRCNPPGQALAVHMNVLQAGTRLFDATLSLRRRALTGSILAGVLLRFPCMTAKVIAAIYWEALRLWLKRIPYHGHSAATAPIAEKSSYE